MVFKIKNMNDRKHEIAEKLFDEGVNAKTGVRSDSTYYAQQIHIC